MPILNAILDGNFVDGMISDTHSLGVVFLMLIM